MSLVYLHELHPLAVLIPAPFTGHNGANSYGYGNRIKTHWMVRIDGRLRRVYCICWSNSGSLYVTLNKTRVYVQESNHIPAQSYKNMETFNVKCVTLADFCDQNNLAHDEVSSALENSDVSFGTNDDTLVSKRTMEVVLGFPVVLPENTFVSLGS